MRPVPTMKWIAIWVEGRNVYEERTYTMPKQTRDKLSEAMKRYWTRARRAKASLLARRRAKERAERVRRYKLTCEAEKRATEAGWAFLNIRDHWQQVEAVWWAAHNDSGDWEIVPGKGLVRTKVYGRPVEGPVTKPKLTDEDHRLLALISRYRDWHWGQWP